jgi:hypothetical protein
MRPFLPSPRETNLLVVLGFAAFGYGLYLRYGLIEAPLLEVGCATGLPRAACGLRRIVIDLHEMEFFGGVALAAAVFHFARPRLAAFAIGLSMAIFGLVLWNSSLSAIAIALLVIGFARPVRPVPASRPLPAPAMQAQTIAPASSKASH